MLDKGHPHTSQDNFNFHDRCQELFNSAVAWYLESARPSNNAHNPKGTTAEDIPRSPCLTSTIRTVLRQLPDPATPNQNPTRNPYVTKNFKLTRFARYLPGRSQNPTRQRRRCWSEALPAENRCRWVGVAFAFFSGVWSCGSKER